VVFLLFDAVLHLLKPAPVAAAFAQLGYPLDLAVGIGILELVCVAIYVIPRTSLLGAILLTGYLGGAVASQLRVGHSFFETGFPMPKVSPTAVLVSHEHGDHNHLAMASGTPKIIRGLDDGQWRTVKEQVDGVAIASVPTYHDATQGKERGRNTVFVIDAEGLRVVHLGDLGHPLDEAA